MSRVITSTRMAVLDRIGLCTSLTLALFQELECFVFCHMRRRDSWHSGIQTCRRSDPPALIALCFNPFSTLFTFHANPSGIKRLPTLCKQRQGCTAPFFLA